MKPIRLWSLTLHAVDDLATFLTPKHLSYTGTSSRSSRTIGLNPNSTLTIHLQWNTTFSISNQLITHIVSYQLDMTFGVEHKIAIALFIQVD